MAKGLANTCSSKRCEQVQNCLGISRELNDGARTSEHGFSSQLQAKRRSKRSSWEVDYYLEDLVWKLRFLVEEFERAIAPIEAELCRLAKEFSGFPEPKWGTAKIKVRKKGREYSYNVLYLLSSQDFTKASKIYLTSRHREELAASYSELYRRVADVLKALGTWCQGLELQVLAKPREEDLSGLETSIELNREGKSYIEFYDEEDEEEELE